MAGNIYSTNNNEPPDPNQDQMDKRANLEPQVITDPNPLKDTSREYTPIPPAPRKKGVSKVLIFLAIFLFLILGILLIALLVRGKAGEVKIASSTREEGQILWWGLREESEMVPLIKEFEAQNEGLAIEYKKQPENTYRERLVKAFTDGTSPDIFSFHNSWSPMFKDNLDSLPDSVMNKDEYNEVFYGSIVRALTLGERIVGIPLSYDALVLYINEDIFARASREVPENWDDFESLAIELTQRDGRGFILQSGASVGYTDNVDHWEEIIGLLMLQNEANLANPALTSPRSIDAIGYYSRLGMGRRVWDLTLPSSTEAFSNGKVGMYLGPSVNSSAIYNISRDLFRFKTYPVPQIRRDSPNEADISYSTFWAEGVWAGSASKEDSWKLLEFMTSQRVLNERSTLRLANDMLPEAFPRKDMFILIKDDPVLGAVVANAEDSKTWYLAGKTNDGAMGINSQIGTIYSDMANALTLEKDLAQVIKTSSNQLGKLLTQYGIQ